MKNAHLRRCPCPSSTTYPSGAPFSSGGRAPCIWTFLISPGNQVVFAAFGGGLTWASAVYRWGSRVEPLGESDAELPPTDLTTMELLQPNFDFFGLPEKLM